MRSSDVNSGRRGGGNVTACLLGNGATLGAGGEISDSSVSGAHIIIPDEDNESQNDEVVDLANQVLQDISDSGIAINATAVEKGAIVQGRINKATVTGVRIEKHGKRSTFTPFEKVENCPSNQSSSVLQSTNGGTTAHGGYGNTVNGDLNVVGTIVNIQSPPDNVTMSAVAATAEEVKEMKVMLKMLAGKTLTNKEDNERSAILRSLLISHNDLKETSNIIGQGSFGAVTVGVYQGIHKVAVKTIASTEAANKSQFAAIESEILLMNYVAPFPAILRCFGYLKEENTIKMVLELSTYGSLDLLLNNYQDYPIIPPSLIIAWLCDIASALQRVHSKQIKHKDLKAENLLMFEKYQLKLCDFGLAKQHTSFQSSNSTAAGTLAFMAPEVRNRQASEYGSDIYSFAMTVIQIASRRPPTDDDPAEQIKNALDRMSGLNGRNDLQSLLIECIRYDPNSKVPINEQRPNAGNVSHKLLNILFNNGGDPRDEGNVFPNVANSNITLSSGSTVKLGGLVVRDSEKVTSITKSLEQLNAAECVKLLTHIGCTNAVDCLVGTNALDGIDLDSFTSLEDFSKVGLEFSSLRAKTVIKRLTNFKQNGVPLSLIVVNDSLMSEAMDRSPLTTLTVNSPEVPSADLKEVADAAENLQQEKERKIAEATKKADNAAGANATTQAKAEQETAAGTARAKRIVEKKGAEAVQVAKETLKKSSTSTTTVTASASATTRSKEDLFKACRYGDLSMVEKCIGVHHIDVHSRDKNGWTPLRSAANYGHLSVVQYLLLHGSDVNEKDELGRTPLLVAAHEGHLSVVRYLLQQGSDVNAKTYLGRTSLHLAAEKGHLFVVQYLLQFGADVNEKEKDGSTPLHLAALKGRCSVVEYLLQHGGDVNAKNKDDKTALDITRNEETKKLLKAKRSWMGYFGL